MNGRIYFNIVSRRKGWKYPYGKNYRAFRAHWRARILSNAITWE